MSIEIVGFDQSPTFRFTAMLGAMEEFGRNDVKIGTIPDQFMFGRRLVCVRVQQFGAVFKPEEVYRLDKTMKRVDAFPQFARQFMADLKDAAEGAQFETQTANKVMI